MATADQIKALIRSHAEGDDTRFYSIALQVAAHAARGGQGRFAEQLRDLIDHARRAEGTRQARPAPVVQPRGELSGLLSAAYPRSSMADLVLEPAVRQRLERVLVEQRQQDHLRARGFRPLRRLLLLGPPWTGKTMSAGVLAAELHLPLFTIRLDGLTTKFMGETAANLRMVFDALDETEAVYLFDEVDALGGERARDNDVGEVRRVLDSFLPFLEQDRSDSILVAATNHGQMLDQAMFRRFDAIIDYPLPSAAAAQAVARNRLATLDLQDVAWDQIAHDAQGLSHAEIALAAERAAKDAILAGHDAISTATLAGALRERHARAAGGLRS